MCAGPISTESNQSETNRISFRLASFIRPLLSTNCNCHCPFSSSSSSSPSSSFPKLLYRMSGSYHWSGNNFPSFSTNSCIEASQGWPTVNWIYPLSFFRSFVWLYCAFCFKWWRTFGNNLRNTRIHTSKQQIISTPVYVSVCLCVCVVSAKDSNPTQFNPIQSNPINYFLQMWMIELNDEIAPHHIGGKK